MNELDISLSFLLDEPFSEGLPDETIGGPFFVCWDYGERIIP